MAYLLTIKSHSCIIIWCCRNISQAVYFCRKVQQASSTWCFRTSKKKDIDSTADDTESACLRQILRDGQTFNASSFSAAQFVGSTGWLLVKRLSALNKMMKHFT